MKFNYKLHRVCGSSYGTPSATNSKAVGSSSGGNVIYDSTGNVLLSPTSNRVQVIDLLTQTTRTLPFECRSNIRTLALTPHDNRLLLVVDIDNYALLANYHRGVVLHRFRFQDTVRCCRFSPSGEYFAIGCGRKVQVWQTPGLRREFAPFVLHRTYVGLADDVTDVHWSSDSSVLLGASRDSTCRIWTVHTVKDYVPVTLSGHRTCIVGAYFEPPVPKQKNKLRRCYTVSSDGALVTWKCTYPDDDDKDDNLGETQPPKDAIDFFSGSATTPLLPPAAFGDPIKDQAHHLPHATWSVEARHYFNQDRTLLTTSAYCPSQGLLTVGFDNGLFGLYELPSGSNIHTLSLSNRSIRTTAINPTGEWLAFGCPSSQQLLVWEWRSETYVIKQKGHGYGMRCMAYSPDGVVIATGGEDGTIKLWNAASGFCYCTLDAHTAAITSIQFSGSAVILTSSLDGTVKAHDLHRYRNFKTYTTPKPVQFLSLAVDRSTIDGGTSATAGAAVSSGGAGGEGEVIAAGTADPFHIYIWNVQSAKLLDILMGHSGPVCSLSFHPMRGILTSASWDGTVKLWDLYQRHGQPESLEHNADVVCVTFRPDGQQLCTGTIGGILSIWKVEDASMVAEIDGRRDITGGRKMNDRMTSDNNSASRYFTSICYSADGAFLLAGGNSKYVCIYEVSQQVLLRKFQISFNRSLDGVLDELNSKNLGDGGPIDEHDNSDDNDAYPTYHLPGAKRTDDGSRRSKVEVLTMQVSFSSTGREWATISNEGLHIYSLDDDMFFDPIALTEAITPAAVQSKLRTKEFGLALLMSLHLNEVSLIRQVIEETPHASISHAVRSVSTNHLERLIQCLSQGMEDSPHVEFFLQWCLEVLQAHGMYMEKHRGSFLRAFRSLHRMIQTRYDELKMLCDENKYTLEFIDDQARLSRN